MALSSRTMGSVRTRAPRRPGGDGSGAGREGREWDMKDTRKVPAPGGDGSRFSARAFRAAATTVLDIRAVFHQFSAPRTVPRAPDHLEEAMARSEITGKRKLLAQNVSHSNIKTKRWQHINIQTRRVWVPELNRFVTLRLTTRDIRTIDKIGVTAYAKRHGVSLGT